MSVYFFDDYQKLLKVINDEKILENSQEREITSDKSELLNDVLTVSIIYDNELKDSSFMGVIEKDNSLSLYRILNTSDPSETLSFKGVGFAPNELDGYVVDEIRPQSQSIKTVTERLLKDTEWRIGHVDSGLKTVSGSFYCISVKEALKQLQTFGCEIIFKCAVNGDGITDKWIEIYKQMGVISNKRFTYGDKALSVVKEIDRSHIFTSLIGRGRGEEVGDGFGRRIEFDAVEWRKSNGKPVDKPKGQKFIEIPELTELYGIPMKDGKMRKREKVVVFEEIEDPNELIQATYDEVVNLSRPLVQFRTEVLGTDSIGNTVTIHRYDREYHYQTRVFKTKVNFVTGEVFAELGDNIVANSSRQASQTSNEIRVINEKKIDFYDSTEVSKYQSDIIRGAKGGSILLMNHEDTGSGTSREPYQMVWMNGDSLATSNHFLVANSEGIGFIDGDFNMDNFKTAWTIDGTFHADWIQAGTLKAIDIEGVNITGSNIKGTNIEGSNIKGTNIEGSVFETAGDDYRIRLRNGNMNVLNSKTGESIGSMFASHNVNTNELSGLSFTQAKGYKFSINTTSEKTGANSYVIEIPKESTHEKPLLKTYASWTHNGSLDIKGSLTVNGQPVTGGTGGGGGWNGQYPPEVISQADKYAWQLWATMIGLGYSKASIAGVLGNVQSEAGDSMNPDTEQSGGPAYGCVQWDGSGYPLVGSPTWNGREYVQRMMKAANIKDNYTTMLAQGKLIDWSGHNGQWSPNTNPTNFANYKTMTDPKDAALSFELNFEKHAGGVQLKRQTDAQNWYNKFKDLKAPEVSGNFIPPISAPITVTSEWGYRTSPFPPYPTEFHNGIDFVNGNPNTPIYASMDGEVVVMGNYPDWYGLYVVIKHANGKYTGYAHNSSVRVAIGDVVVQGQQIANMGTTGPSTAEHCHFQIMNAPWPQTNEGFENPRGYIFG